MAESAQKTIKSNVSAKRARAARVFGSRARTGVDDLWHVTQ